VVTAFKTHGIELFPWQQAAVEAWVAGDDDRSCFGTLEVVTGGGKTLIALKCVEKAALRDPAVQLVVVVPTQALARQWREQLISRTSLAPGEIGLMGAGGRGDLGKHRALVAVLNTAAKKLPEMARQCESLMLIVDECHRAGAPSFSKVLDTRARYRLGLSATPDREEIDEDGQALAYDEQLVGQSLGPVVYRFGLKEARQAGWLPEYTLHHHAVALTEGERVRYDTLSRQVDDAADALRGLGGDTSRSRQLVRRQDDLGEAARRWVSTTSQRKDLLYRAAERHRVAGLLLERLFAQSDELGDTLVPAGQPRAILFHERVDEAVELASYLAGALPVTVAVEHSRLPESQRVAALRDFASGRAPVLVSVKSLIEGIDVPAADTGVSVASNASVRQRIQALGRVLRRIGAAEDKKAEMNLLYVDDSVDDLIYGKTDWSDLTGADANRYWRWKDGATDPEPLPGPPRTPRPTESAAWEHVRDSRAELPVVWPGEVSGQEYTVSTTGVVHNAFRKLIENPQGVSELIASFRGRLGGRFHVTPEHRLVLVWQASGGDDPQGPTAWLFRVAEDVTDASDIREQDLEPGRVYLGPTDKTNGTFKISQRGGGNIERAVAGGRELADAVGETPQEVNARSILGAWESLNRVISRFSVNELGHAWYEADGERRFLAHVPEGFSWPTENNGEE
jgi:superfamily II DNA or RNA helicase